MSSTMEKNMCVCVCCINEDFASEEERGARFMSANFEHTVDSVYFEGVSWRIQCNQTSTGWGYLFCLYAGTSVQLRYRWFGKTVRIFVRPGYPFSERSNCVFNRHLRGKIIREVGEAGHSCCFQGELGWGWEEGRGGGGALIHVDVKVQLGTPTWNVTEIRSARLS